MYTVIHQLVVDVPCVLFWTQSVCIAPKQNTQNLYHKQMNNRVDSLSQVALTLGKFHQTGQTSSPWPRGTPISPTDRSRKSWSESRSNCDNSAMRDGAQPKCHSGGCDPCLLLLPCHWRCCKMSHWPAPTVRHHQIATPLTHRRSPGTRQCRM